ncbi:hypothetical protein HanRHA438_Chr02g0093891 [Helianthus annuus]|nr:hypothetical protein HanRHA438_Chr02g0093891 [Helianthus annuus]
MILENKMVKPESRGTLIKFMQLMVSHHLSRRLEAPWGYWTFCRRNSQYE